MYFSLPQTKTHETPFYSIARGGRDGCPSTRRATTLLAMQGAAAARLVCADEGQGGCTGRRENYSMKSMLACIYPRSAYEASSTRTCAAHITYNFEHLAIVSASRPST